ncbi:[protein-PII] uridylyltransferase [Dietzia sp.]|uniref:[protein-PII] uridylyltransferase n=1 Tax=Dietzia sp. TaxID=1871616 RepID=UPI002FD8A8F5
MGHAPETGHTAGQLRAELSGARAGLLDAARTGRLSPAGLRASFTELYDFLLLRLADDAGVAPGSGYALAAFGGLGRREMLPYSDLDLLLLYDGGGAGELQDVADALWYPLWDARVPLDHSVRTPAQSLRLAADDSKVALGLLDIRHIAGDAELTGKVRDGAVSTWRKTVHSQLDGLVESIEARRRRAGAIAHRNEPDLKYGEGGLRDAQVLGSLAVAHVANDAIAAIPNAPGLSVTEARELILNARTALHLHAGKARDILHAQYADDVAATLGLGDDGSPLALAHALSAASRTIAFATDLGIRTARGSVPRRGLAALRRAPARTPLAEGVVEQGGEVVLARGARPDRDDSLLLRIAVAAARNVVPISAGTLRRLAESSPAASQERGTLFFDTLVELLGTGPGCIPVIESLDRSGLWDRVLPEWSAVRDLPSRSTTHVYTVDRHLVQTVAEAARATTAVSRPDLLLFAALVHDLGKGRDRDHSELGAELAMVICERMGMAPADSATIVTLVRHHLLLAATAAKSDPGSPETARRVIDELGGAGSGATGVVDGEILELLAALTEADSRATGPGVWTPWKAEMLDTLVESCRAELESRAGEGVRGSGGDGHDLQARALGAERGAAGRCDAGLLGETLAEVPTTSRIAFSAGEHASRFVLDAVIDGGTEGLADILLVLASRGIEVVHAETRHQDLGEAGEIQHVRADISTLFGPPADPALVLQDLRALSSSSVRSRLRDSVARRRAGDSRTPLAEPRAWFVEEPGGPRGTGILRVRSADRAGLLAEMISACRAAGLGVEWSRAGTVGGIVDDTVAVYGLTGGEGAGDRLAAAVRAILPAPPREPGGGNEGDTGDNAGDSEADAAAVDGVKDARRPADATEVAEGTTPPPRG